MRHLILFTVACLMLIASLPGPVAAHRPTDPPHQLYQVGDFTLESGQVIKDFAISYVTHGMLNAQKSNAILMVTALSGNHHRLDFLIGPGKALDTTKYFIVATDAISNGLTTSPSNSKAQPRMQFPRFSIRDMVHSQHRLLINNPDSITGHFAAGGFQPADVEQISVEVERFLDIVTQRGARLK
jgi:homoserine O-acetyltransferase